MPPRRKKEKCINITCGPDMGGVYGSKGREGTKRKGEERINK